MEKKTVAINMRITERERERLEEYADEHDMTISEVIRMSFKLLLTGANDVNIIVV